MWLDAVCLGSDTRPTPIACFSGVPPWQVHLVPPILPTLRGNSQQKLPGSPTRPAEVPLSEFIAVQDHQ